MSTTFGSGATRRIQAGDTPDLNDGLLSRNISDGLNLARGNACVLQNGEIFLATVTLTANGDAPFVPVESVDNSANGEVASGVAAPQRVALLVDVSSSTINPGDYVRPSDNADGTVERFVRNSDNFNQRYARYLGKEAALLDVDTSTPFEETLTPGIVPDQALTPTSDPADNVGWFQLVESSGGVVP